MQTLLAGIFCLTAIFVTQASATIVSGAVTGGYSSTNGGAFINLTVPFTEPNPDNTVGSNTFDGLNLYGFDESRNVHILSDLNVDVLAGNVGGSSGGGAISAGILVASHYIFFDPLNFVSQRGAVTFDSNVLGILSSRGSLSASDSLLSTGVTYLNPSLPGLESGDSVSIFSLKMMQVDWSASSPSDYVRVLTAYSREAVPIPVPAAVWLFGSSFVGLVGFSRRTTVPKMVVERFDVSS